MENVEIERAWTTVVDVRGGAVARGCARVCDVDGRAHVFAATRAADGGAGVVCGAADGGRAAAWAAADVTRFLLAPDDAPVALDGDPAALDPLVVATRRGALLSVDPRSGDVALVGEVVDDDGRDERGGVLALSKSPDGGVVAIVSPVRVSVVTAAWEPVGEVDLEVLFGVLATAASLSWRGDGTAFVVCVTGENGAVAGCVVDRDVEDTVKLDLGGISHVSDGNSRLGPAVSWQPRPGGVICLAGPAAAVSGFERNGLRHQRNDFSLQTPGGVTSALENGKIACVPRELAWSSDSTFLAVLLDSSEESVQRVEIYVRSNYKWYCKQCVPLHGACAAVFWDPELQQTLRIIYESGKVSSFSMRLSNESAVSLNSLCGVVDGTRVKFTNLAKAIIPPPLSHSEIDFGHPVVSICHSAQAEPALVGVFLATGEFEVLGANRVCTRIGDFGASKDVSAPELHPDGRWAICLPRCDNPSVLSLAARARRFAFMASSLVAFVDDSPYRTAEPGKGLIRLHYLEPGAAKSRDLHSLHVNGNVQCLRVVPWSSSGDSVCMLVATSASLIYAIGLDGDSDAEASSCELVEYARVFCSAAQEAVSCQLWAGERQGRCIRLIVVRDRHGRLEVVEMESERSSVASHECSSFCLSREHLIFTSRSNGLHCLPIYPWREFNTLEENKDAREQSPLGEKSIVEALGLKTEPSSCGSVSRRGLHRPIDHGSVILCCLPCKVSLVLRIPRGNLEVISPRPLAIAEVHRLSLKKHYGVAFRLSRKQRIDMSVMRDANFDEFLKSIPQVVDEIGDPNHLSVFLSYMRGTESEVNTVCDKVAEAIESMEDGESKNCFIPSVLTALLIRQPQRFDSALRLVKDCFSRSSDEGSKALDFLLVLAKNETKVYEEALGTYDLSLALMVAKASQLDPIVYSSEMRALHGMTESYRRYTIDMKLQRYGSALQNLFDCGTKFEKACLDHAGEHMLFLPAIKLFHANRAAVNELRLGYAEHLVSVSSYAEAAEVYVAAGRLDLAADAYKEAGLWRLGLSSFWRFQENCRGLMSKQDAEVCKQEVEYLHEYRTYALSLAETLTEQGRIVDAATLRHTVLHDVAGALDDLVSGEEWSFAFQLCSTVVLQPRVIGSMNGLSHQDLYATITAALLQACAGLTETLNEDRSKLSERLQRLITLRETKEMMKQSLGTPGNSAGLDTDSDAFSASSYASSRGSHATDMTFASSAGSVTSRTSLYSSVGRGGGGRVSAARERKAKKAARKRVRTGHPREEEALVATLKRLVPNEHIRNRVGRTIAALVHANMFGKAYELSDCMDSLFRFCVQLPSDILSTDDVRCAMLDSTWRSHVVDAVRVNECVDATGISSG